MVDVIGPFGRGRVTRGDESSARAGIAAGVLKEEISRRCRSFTFRDSPQGDGSIDFVLTHEGGDVDTFGITVRRSGGSATVDIRGNGETSLLHAVGKLLRNTGFDGGVSLPLIDVKLKATHQHRGHELSTCRYLDSWGLKDWDSYTRELALWGANWIWSTTSCSAPLEGCSEETGSRWERHCAIQDAQAEIASSYGMRFGVHSFPNNISPDLVTPEISFRGPYVCPSNPRARHLILESREMLFRRLGKIDAVFTSSHDPGGCPCEKCTPWVETFVPLMEEEALILREHNPGAQFYISNQALARSENEWLFDYLGREMPDWLTGIVWGPQSRPLQELRDGLPDKYGILAFPDITHLILCQYPVLGFDHANALVHHRESPTYRPMAMERIFQETTGLSGGSMPYSEGVHDDLNKAVWSCLHWGMKPAESVAEYARWHFGPGIQKDVQKLIFDLEKSWKRPVISNPDIHFHLAAVEELGPRVAGGGGNWRYQMLLLRCLVDLYVQVRLRRERDTERKAIQALGNVDVEIESRIRSALELLGAPADAMEGELSGRISTTGRDLRESLGLVFHPVERLEVPLSNIPWTVSRLREARAGDGPERESMVSGITDYDKTVPGGYYEDCGNVETGSHRVEGEDYFLEDIDPTVRLSRRRMSYGRSEWDSDVVYRFGELHPGSPYRLSVTYLANRRMRGSQLLLANGAVLHGDKQLPEDEPGTFDFEIPVELNPEGRLELRFRRGDAGRGPLVSEIRISPKT